MAKQKVMSSLLSEELVPITRSGQFCPGRPTPSSMYRWAKDGIRGVKLESIRIGGQVMTSKEAVARFITALNNDGK